MGWIYFDLEARKKRAVEESQKYVQHALVISRSEDPIKDAQELRDLSVALRYDIRNAKAARRTCQLLYGKDWCVPMTSSLHYNNSSYKINFCAATLGPQGSRTKIFAVSEDGELLLLRNGKPALVRNKVLFSAGQPSGTENDKSHTFTPTTAFFSDDGKWLLLILPASARFDATFHGQRKNQ